MALFLPAEHVLGQNLILLLYNLNVFRRQGSGVIGGAHHRLHAQLGKSQVVRHMEQVLGEVRVGVGEGAPHVVVLPAPGRHQLLELGHNAVVAAVARVVHPGAVVDFLAPVQREHHVAHLPVGKVNHIVVDEHAVGGEGEAEVFAPLLFHAAGVLHQALNHVPVHQRLSAEEVHLQVAAGAGVVHQEVQGLLAHLKAHQSPVAVVLALAGEAVLAVEIAGVGHVEAQCFHHVAGALFKGPRHAGEGVRAEELPGVL